MVKGKPWSSAKEERQRNLVAELLGLSPEDVQRKGKKMPSIKKAERIFAEALTASCKPGLDEIEVLRLHVCADLAQVYRDLAVGYVGYYFIGQSCWRQGL